jgi:kumamolisin
LLSSIGLARPLVYGTAAALILLSTACLAGPAAPSRLAAGSAKWPAILAASKNLGPVDPGQALTLSLLLRQPEAGPAVSDIYNPASPQFGRYLTPNQYDASFGPRLEQVRALQAAVRRLGLDLSWQRGSPAATLSGPAAIFQRVLNTQINVYLEADGQRFYASTAAPSLPPTLSTRVEPPDRVTNWLPPLHRDAVRPGGVTPPDLARAYDFQRLRDQGADGSGQTVVFWELGDGFRQEDFDAFNHKFHLPTAVPQLVGGPSTSSQGETIMDLEAVHAIAPGAKLVVYSLGARQKELTDGQLMQAVQGTIDDNPGAIITYSWGGCEPGQGSTLAHWFERMFTKADAVGSSLFAATGDSGGYDCLAAGDTKPASDAIGVSLPASAPGITAVGATRLSLNKDGGWFNEVPWEFAADSTGGGGGVSTVFPRPAWQKAAGVDNRWNPGRMRSVPDVSALGDPSSGLAIVNRGAAAQGGGSSLSAPIWAGITALINQYLIRQGLKPVGFFSPTLYAIASGHPPHPAFHDITQGGNLVYPAQPGYDLASGLGSPDVWNLAQDVAQYQRDGGHI